eukprot:gnl/MRDRNA2_/MRDRNA2_59368_c0_seq1.p1 gnl/MRDRNA2_/MRDRNA2_59368_c0~~gnl/MRDRNA2_/MRDRNA2_59368_c0_seq1.p1  ORF type:complete len:309 (+),score=75.59 gnl/MRDRNA2_/MRDRNA2_59368_c0_seq1:119-1045(+)
MAPSGLECVRIFDEVQRLTNGHPPDPQITDSFGNITIEELEVLRSLKKPPTVVRRTLEVVCLILDAAKTSAPASPPNWPKVQRMLEQNFVKRMLDFDAEVLHSVPKLTRYVVAEYFGVAMGDDAARRSQACGHQNKLTFSRVSHASRAAGALFRWSSMHLKRVCEQLHSEGEEQDEQDDQGEQEGLDGQVDQQHEQDQEEKQAKEEARVKEETQLKAEDEAHLKAEEEAQLKNEFWEVLTDSGWVRDDIITKRLRSVTFWEGVTAGTPTFEYSARGFSYLVNVISMTQLNKYTQKVRSIRRRGYDDMK